MIRGLCWAVALWCILGSCLPAGAQTKMRFLRADGKRIVDEAGRPVVLSGFNLNGAFCVEMWASAFDMDRRDTAFPEIKAEKALWDVLEQRFGPQKLADLRSTWRKAWATPADIERMAALGCNSVRIPFWYRLVDDPARPGTLDPAGLKMLDDLVDACAKHGVYAILDLHGTPGCQSKDHHSGEVDRNQLWGSREHREHTARLWAALARHYRDRPEVAAYDLMNEPMGAPDARTLIEVHDQIIRAIRAVDGRHLIICEDGYKGFGTFPNDWKSRGWRNVIFSFHIYRFDAKNAQTHLDNIRENMPKWIKAQEALGVPIFIGEFNTISREAGGMETLGAYIDAFNAAGWGWSVWSYKKLSGRNGCENFWGLVANDKPWERPNPFKDPFDELQRKFALYDTANLVMQPAFAEAIRKRCGKK